MRLLVCCPISQKTKRPMLPSLFLLFAPHAQASTTVLMLDVASPSQERQALRSTGQRDAMVTPADSLGSLLKPTLARYAAECAPPLSTEETEALRAQVPEQGALFIALPTPNDALVWRWDAQGERLHRVLRWNKASQPPTIEEPAHVVFLPWPGTSQAERPPKVDMARLGRPEHTVVTDVEHAAQAIDALVEHPNECQPEMTDHLVGLLNEQQAEAGDTDVFVAVQNPRGRDSYVWRYDPESQMLQRLFGWR